MHLQSKGWVATENPPPPPPPGGYAPEAMLPSAARAGGAHTRCPYVPVTSWDTAGDWCYPAGGAMFSPCLSHQEQARREEVTSETQAPGLGRLLPMFLAEIGPSTSLPVLLLPVRPVAEEMLTPRHSSADLGRAWAGRLLPLCRINPSSCGGSFLQIQTNKSRKMWLPVQESFSWWSRASVPAWPKQPLCLTLDGSLRSSTALSWARTLQSVSTGPDTAASSALSVLLCIIHIKPSNMLVYNISFYSTKAVWTWWSIICRKQSERCFIKSAY